MPTVTKCPECRQSMKLGDAAAGKRVRCPGCKHVFVAPGGEEEPEVIECAVVEEPAKRPAPRPVLDDEEEDRPRRKARREDEEDEDDRPAGSLGARRTKRTRTTDPAGGGATRTTTARPSTAGSEAKGMRTRRRGR